MKLSPLLTADSVALNRHQSCLMRCIRCCILQKNQFTIPMPVSPEKMQKLQEMMQRLGVHKNDLEEKFVRGSGKGGQKINKTNNLVNICL